MNAKCGLIGNRVHVYAPVAGRGYHKCERCGDFINSAVLMGETPPKKKE